MIWIMGAGRCGSGSAAEFFDVVWQPAKGLKTSELYEAYRGLKERDEPAVVDLHRPSLLLPELKELDPEMKVVWQIRNPFDGVASAKLINLAIDGPEWVARNWSIYHAIQETGVPYCVKEPTDWVTWQGLNNVNRDYQFERMDAIELFHTSYEVFYLAMQMKENPTWELDTETFRKEPYSGSTHRAG